MSCSLYCVCCLERNTQFIQLAKCSHVGFLEKFTEFKQMRSSSVQVVCAWCHAMLMRIENFRRQVEHSFCLQSQSLKSLHSDVKINKLSIHEATFIDTTQDPVKTEHFLHVHNSEDANEDKDFTLTEIKLENEKQDASEETFYDDICIPLVEPKTESESESDDKLQYFEEILEVNTRSKRKKSPASKVGESKASKCEGKIRQLELTEAELVEERLQLSQSDKYLKLPFRCDTCLVSFDYEPALNNHVHKKHTNLKAGGSMCPVCDSILNSDSAYKEHMHRHYRRFECIVCGKRSSDLHSLLLHHAELHSAALDAPLYRCHMCDFTTQSHRKFRYHKEKHGGARQCTQCERSFVNNSTLKTHVNRDHGPSRTFTCPPPCGKSFKQRSALNSHRAAHHAGTSAVYCAPCDKLFKTRANYLHHLQLSAAHRPTDFERYQCDECGSSFVHKHTLLEHINFTHLRDTRHKCARCGDRSFRTSSTLRAHVSRVHDKVPQPRDKICQHCGKGFTSTVILRHHIRTHTGERPLLCAHCPATFAHSSARYTHTKLLHKDKMSRSNPPHPPQST